MRSLIASWLAACALVLGPARAHGQSMAQLGAAHQRALQANRYEDALEFARRGFALAKARRDARRMGAWATLIGTDCAKLGRDGEAIQAYETGIALLRRTEGDAGEHYALAVWSLAGLYKQRSRYDKAEPLLREALAAFTKGGGPESPGVANVLAMMGWIAMGRGAYTEAEQLILRELRIREQTAGPESDLAGATLDTLGSVYLTSGRTLDAERCYRRALAISEKMNGPDHILTAMTLRNLGSALSNQGRYAEAEDVLKRSIGIFRSKGGTITRETIHPLFALGDVYTDQRRTEEAEATYRLTLELQEKALGPDDLDCAFTLVRLAGLLSARGEYDEAGRLYHRVLALREKVLGQDSPPVAWSYLDLAEMEMRRHRYDEAEPPLDRAESIFRKLNATGTKEAGDVPRLRARLALARGRNEDALAQLDRLEEHHRRTGAGPGPRFESLWMRSTALRDLGRRDEALADLRSALDQAEQARIQSSGAEREHASAFAAYTEGFATMVAWQAERGDPAEAFAALERAHARSLWDELALAGTDFDAGLSEAERRQLQAREGVLRSRVAELETRLARAERDDEAARLRDELEQARAALYAFARDRRNGSKLYRDLLARGPALPSLGQVQRRLLRDGDLLLAYGTGLGRSYLLAVTRDEARVVELTLGPEAAKALGAQPGPLTEAKLFEILVGEKRQGVIPRLSSPDGPDATPALAALWTVLVPEDRRGPLAAGEVKHLYVVPDGPLALLPFEALVVEGAGEGAKFLLDVGPGIAYGPSAAVLTSLATREAAGPSHPDREPVLTLGDPSYAAPGAEDPKPETRTARSRYARTGGTLARLPFSGWEAEWVAKAFRDAGLPSGVLSGATATERGVRHWAPGRRVLHLACHGRTDLELGNYFGALALTPGPGAATDPKDDGFLTLPEIQELDLRGCELAVLSACETNLGPEQRGEGLQALTRGFLVAGARRVVASNWLVDDEAAASLMSVYATSLARGMAGASGADYARALRDAKRWVRGQAKWRRPYYWASLVLVGPS